MKGKCEAEVAVELAASGKTVEEVARIKPHKVFEVSTRNYTNLAVVAAVALPTNGFYDCRATDQAILSWLRRSHLSPLEL